MTSPKFAVGDRVSCYGNPECGTFYGPTIEGDYGTVVDLDPVGWVGVNLDSNYGKDKFHFHPKQLRRLKPKPKAEVKVPREWKMLYQPRDPQGIVSIHICREWYVEGPLPEPLKTFSVREVIPGSVSVTREQLAKAWDTLKHPLTRSGSSCVFKSLCKAVGLGEA